MILDGRMHQNFWNYGEVKLHQRGEEFIYREDVDIAKNDKSIGGFESRTIIILGVREAWVSERSIRSQEEKNELQSDNYLKQRKTMLSNLSKRYQWNFYIHFIVYYLSRNSLINCCCRAWWLFYPPPEYKCQYRGFGEKLGARTPTQVALRKRSKTR